MLPSRTFFVATSVSCSLALGACNGPISRVSGLDPVLDSTAVSAASENKHRLLRALAADAGFAGEPIDWYLVAEAGFNYVQDQCTAYFDELYKFDRQREAFKSSFSIFGQTTSALLAITGASAPSIAAAAQAFGLGSSMTDIVGGTYLYRRPPASAQTLVERLQLAFRDGAARQRPSINSPTAAYYNIQRFLSLCLPPRIEAEIDRQIGATQVVAVDQGPGSPFSLETLTPPSPGLAAAGRVGRILGERAEYYAPNYTRRRQAKDVVETDPEPVAVVANARTNAERKISRGLGIKIEGLLCQGEDADLGASGSSRRDALRVFRSVFGLSGDAIESNQEISIFRKAIQKYRSCSEAKFRSPYEAALWTRYGASGIRERLRGALRSSGGAIMLSDTAGDKGPSSEIRAAIKALDTSGLGEITPALWRRITPEPL